MERYERIRLAISVIVGYLFMLLVGRFMNYAVPFDSALYIQLPSLIIVLASWFIGIWACLKIFKIL